MLSEMRVLAEEAILALGCPLVWVDPHHGLECLSLLAVVGCDEVRVVTMV
jgi:hypothetical protein